MHISENKVFIFKFPYEGGDITIPVPAESREQAVEKFQKWLNSVQMELAMEFPKTSVNTIAPAGASTPVMPLDAEDGLSEILLDRIDNLLITRGGKDLKDAAKAETIKNWTELEFVPANYSKIVNELEMIASGAKEVPAKPKKK